MPKLPPIEKFHVLCEIDKDKLGEDMSLFSRNNIKVVSCELVTSIPTFAQRANHDTNADQFLTEWIKDNPTFKAIEAGRHFEANGRSKTGVYGAITSLVEKGVLKKLSPGNYARADVKHLDAPKKEGKKEAKAAPTMDRREINHREFILRAARRSHGRFNTARMKELFIKDGRKPGAVSPSIDDLIKKKQVKRVGEGEYILMQKATPQAPLPKTNGNGKHEPVATPADEVTHG